MPDARCLNIHAWLILSLPDCHMNADGGVQPPDTLYRDQDLALPAVQQHSACKHVSVCYLIRTALAGDIVMPRSVAYYSKQNYSLPVTLKTVVFSVHSCIHLRREAEMMSIYALS